MSNPDDNAPFGPKLLAKVDPKVLAKVRALIDGRAVRQGAAAAEANRRAMAELERLRRLTAEELRHEGEAWLAAALAVPPLGRFDAMALAPSPPDPPPSRPAVKDRGARKVALAAYRGSLGIPLGADAQYEDYNGRYRKEHPTLPEVPRAMFRPPRKVVTK